MPSKRQQMPDIIKIAVTGPESTGKSMLATQLADHYQTVHVPEFARIQLLKSDGKYNYDDILEIARGQVASEKVLETIANKILISDTELLVTKIWCEVKYKKCHPWIIQKLKQQQYGLYLLTDIDLPWEPDPLREHPHHRQELMNLYQQNLRELGFNYSIISGTGADRLKNAIHATETYLSNIRAD
jgi:NadR type nicotinamide-nucleotide adenylyltransferase